MMKDLTKAYTFNECRAWIVWYPVSGLWIGQIKEIEKKGKEETEINFDEKIQKLSEKIEKAHRNIEKWEMEIKKLKGRNDDFEKDW